MLPSLNALAVPRRTIHTKKLTVNSSEAEKEKFVQYLTMTLIKDMQAINPKRKAPSISSNREFKNSASFYFYFETGGFCRPLTTQWFNY